MTSSQKRALLYGGAALGVGFLLFEFLKKPTAAGSAGPESPAPPGLPPPRTINTSQALVVTNSGPLLMRDIPSTDGKIIEQIPKGQSVLLAPVIQQNGFQLVFYQGTLGWVYSGFLQDIPVSGPAPAPTSPPPTPSNTIPLIRFLGNPLNLEQGKLYQARLELSGFSTLATPSQIADRFSELGFSGVQVFTNKGQLPAGWPTQTTSGDTGNTRWAQGIFTRPSIVIPKPDLIVQVWEPGFTV